MVERLKRFTTKSLFNGPKAKIIVGAVAVTITVGAIAAITIMNMRKILTISIDGKEETHALIYVDDLVFLTKNNNSYFLFNIKKKSCFSFDKIGYSEYSLTEKSESRIFEYLKNINFFLVNDYKSIIYAVTIIFIIITGYLFNKTKNGHKIYTILLVTSFILIDSPIFCFFSSKKNSIFFSQIL